MNHLFQLLIFLNFNATELISKFNQLINGYFFILKQDDGKKAVCEQKNFE